MPLPINARRDSRSPPARDDGVLRRPRSIGVTHARVYTAPLRGGGAVDRGGVARRDRPRAAAGSASGSSSSAAIGIARRGGARRVRRGGGAASDPAADAAAEQVAATGDLTERVDGAGGDELGRLAGRFNAMLAALEESVGRQRRLVADASHELRTPLTAARTNVDLLREGKLPADEARRALDEAAVELDALTRLVSDLVELARGEERKLRIEDVQPRRPRRGDRSSVRSRARRRSRSSPRSPPTMVSADPMLLERAISNLLDNAVKYSPEGAPIEVSVRAGEVVVAGPRPGDRRRGPAARLRPLLPRRHVARSKPGAGLGLAIVREAAEAHGGTAATAASARSRTAAPARPRASPSPSDRRRPRRDGARTATTARRLQRRCSAPDCEAEAEDRRFERSTALARGRDDELGDLGRRRADLDARRPRARPSSPRPCRTSPR